MTVFVHIGMGRCTYSETCQHVVHPAHTSIYSYNLHLLLHWKNLKPLHGQMMASLSRHCHRCHSKIGIKSLITSCKWPSNTVTLTSSNPVIGKNGFCSLAQSALKMEQILEIPTDDTTLRSTGFVSESDGDDHQSLGIYQRIRRASTPEEVSKLLDEYHIEFAALRRVRGWRDPFRWPTVYRVWAEAIKQCFKMGEEESGWNLFALCKERGMATSYIYSVAMYYSFYFDPTERGMTRCFDLFHEMNREQNLIPTAMVDAVLIDICCKMGAFEKGYDVMDRIKRSKHRQVLLSSQTLLLSAAKLWVKSGNIDYGLKFMFNVYKTYRVIPNTMQCHYLLKGLLICALMVHAMFLDVG